ncbi:MAG: hypothetical protein IJJ33_11200 [Victivallales bacterium]|nr:hypothetical protein [Victivallales bacterium]
MNYLSRNQYSWELLMPGEASDAEVVLSLKNGEIIEERSGSRFGDFSLLDYCFLRESPRKTAVLEENGSLADGIFLREYADDTLLLVNLTDNDRRLRLRHAGKMQEVFLFRRGVLVVDGSPMDNRPYGKRTPLPLKDAEISWEAPHTLRSDFRDGADSFSLSGKISGLTLAVRKHPAPVQLTLDGKAVTFTRESPALPPGFQELYQVTAPFSLEAGKHTLHLKNGARDYPYLPAAFLLGNFASSPEKNLSPEVNNAAHPLYGYAGRFTQKVRVTLPADARCISSPKQRFAGELFLDGKSCGRRLAHPFRWEIPAECRGKDVVLEMQWFPSCGQLFGERCFSSPEAGVLLRKFAPDNRRATAIPRLFLEQ